MGTYGPERRHHLVRILVEWDLLPAGRIEALRVAAEARGEPLERLLVADRVLDAAVLAEVLSEVRFRTSDGPLLSRYAIESTLGRGGSGVVYRAIERESGRSVALKILRERPEANGEDRRRFQREARAYERLDHPNIVRVHDAGSEGEWMYLVMDLVEGRGFAEHVAARRATDREGLLEQLESIARAVHHAHERGVLHRDLKPTNVLVADDGRPIVTDFGLARLSGGAGSKLTREGNILGTPAYMSPEQALGKVDRMSPATDVYALGVMLYEILTGRLPHSGRSGIEICLSIVRETPPRPRQIDPSIPAALDELATYAMAKDPDHRLASAAGFADRLAAARGAPAGPILPPPPDPEALGPPDPLFRTDRVSVELTLEDLDLPGGTTVVLPPEDRAGDG